MTEIENEIKMLTNKLLDLLDQVDDDIADKVIEAISNNVKFEEE